MDADEALKRYADGERDFRLQDLKSLSFIQVNLNGADFSGANLSRSDLSNSDLSNVKLNRTVLKGANFKGENLKGAKKLDGRMHNNYLESTNYFSV